MDVAADLTSTGNSNDGEITVTWDALDNATSYTVTVKDAQGAPVGTITSTGATSAHVAGLDEQAEYKVTVVANNGSVDSTVSDATSVKTLKEFKSVSWVFIYNNNDTSSVNIGNEVNIVYKDATVGEEKLDVELTNPNNSAQVVSDIMDAITDSPLNGLLKVTFNNDVGEDYKGYIGWENAINFVNDIPNKYHFITTEKGKDVILGAGSDSISFVTDFNNNIEK